jgi:FlaA1/EpsC-like NDP-sugar epimerase
MNLNHNIDGSRILITGGTGSFGNHVIDKLLDEQSL